MINPRNEFTWLFCYLLCHVFNKHPRVNWPNTQSEQLEAYKAFSTEIQEKPDEDFQMKMRRWETLREVLKQKEKDETPTLNECIMAAHEAELSVLETEKGIIVTDYYHSWRYVLTILEQDDQTSPYVVTFSLLDVKHKDPWIEVTYFKTFDCPCLVSKQYIHPLAIHTSIPENTRLRLLQLDQKISFSPVNSQIHCWKYGDR